MAIGKKKKDCSHLSAKLFVELYSAEVLIGILLIQQTDMCEWEVTSFAITLPFPLTTHINLRNLYQLTDLQSEPILRRRQVYTSRRKGLGSSPSCLRCPPHSTTALQAYPGFSGCLLS